MSLVVLLTGTSRGVGHHVEQHLRARGHTVVGSSRRGGDGRLVLDVTDPASCASAVASVLAAEGRIDALVNNAGSHLFGAATETSEDALRAQMELNFHGAVHMTQAVLPHFLERGAGRIVNMSSVGGRFATPFTGAYAASKFALEGWMEALRLEVLSHGVYVTNLEPGYVATGTTEQSVQEVQQADPRFAMARRAAHRRALEEGPRGLSLDAVAVAVERALRSPRPPLRVSIDGLATRLAVLRAVLPASVFEQLVLRQTAPELCVPRPAA